MEQRKRLIELIRKADKKGLIFYRDNEAELSFAKLILDDGWIRPPCKVGDSCYPLDASEKEFTCEEKISRITISERNIIIGYYEHWDYRNKCRKTNNWRLPLRTRILGKGVFLSLKEAEAEIERRNK